MPIDIDDVTITLTTPSPVSVAFPPPQKYVAGQVVFPPLGIEMVEQGPQGLRGPAGPPGSAGGVSYNQSIPAATWVINHGLNRYPAVVTRDSTGEVIVGNVTYIDLNNAQVDFSAATGGSAYLV